MNYSANVKRDQAKQLLIHYFAQAGVKMERDTHVEIADIVDTIVDAAVIEARDERKDAVGA